MSSRSSSKAHSSSVSFPGYHRVGFVKSAHGIRGELFIGLFAARADWESDTLSLLKPGASELTTYEVNVLRPHKEGLIVKFVGVNSRNEAELLRKSQVYIPQAALVSEPGEPIFLHQVQDFDLIDKDGNLLGRIVGFATNGAQDLLRVASRNEGGSARTKGEALVPFIDEFLVDIDFDKKQVHMDLPPGLLNLEEE